MLLAKKADQKENDEIYHFLCEALHPTLIELHRMSDFDIKTKTKN